MLLSWLSLSMKASSNHPLPPRVGVGSEMATSNMHKLPKEGREDVGERVKKEGKMARGAREPRKGLIRGR